MSFNINSIAIIGTGIAGLSSIYESLHTTKDGTSTVGSDEKNTNPAFTKVVAFEQNDTVAGIWGTDLSKDPQPSQTVYDSEEYNDVKVIRNKNKNIPPLEELKNSSVNNPIITAIDSDYNPWKKIGVYPGLYTFVARKFMRFSTMEPSDKVVDVNLGPLAHYKDVYDRFDDFSNKNDLTKYIRFNTEVVNLVKDEESNKWILTLLKTDLLNNESSWYQESFDAVIIATGHYSIPYIPHFKGLAEFIKKNDKEVSIIHSKQFRDPLDFKDENVLIVGSSISALDIAQFVYPVAKHLTISSRPDFESPLPWLKDAIQSFDNVGLITEFDPETKSIKTSDGKVLNDITSIIFCTGYHIEVPFYDGLEYTIPEGSKDITTPRSRIKGLYQNIFNIEDPTLAFNGAIYSPYLTKGVEAIAAAICGIWSNSHNLPSKEDQYKWERKREELTKGTLYFNKYSFDNIDVDFVDQIKEFFPDGRNDPLENDVKDQMVLYYGMEHSKKLFYSFRNGELPVNYGF